MRIPSSLPSTLLAAELQDCTLEEHELAAQLISSNEEGLVSLQKVQTAVKDLWMGKRSRFNPMKEYCNVGVAGCNARKMLSQQKLMTLGEQHLPGSGELVGDTN